MARYDFDTASLAAPKEITSGQPMLAGEELFGALDAVNQLPEVVAALEQRGITGSDGLCLPRTVGRFFSDLANPVNDRLVRFDCFNIRGQSGLGLLPTTSAYARPVEGISVLFDIEELNSSKSQTRLLMLTHHPMTLRSLSFTRVPSTHGQH